MGDFVLKTASRIHRSTLRSKKQKSGELLNNFPIRSVISEVTAPRRAFRRAEQAMVLTDHFAARVPHGREKLVAHIDHKTIARKLNPPLNLRWLNHQSASKNAFGKQRFS